MRLFDPFLYERVHLLIVLAFSVFYFIILRRKSADKLITRKNTAYGIIIYSLLFVFVVGFRPVSPAFGDTVNYAIGYQDYSKMVEKVISSRDSLFYSFMWLCSQFMSVNGFFFIVEIGYVIPILIACLKFLKKNADIGLLFCLSAFSFFPYSVNGIRNGMSLSLVLLALSLIRGKVVEKVICVIISVLAISFHASAALPVLCFVVSTFIKKPKYFFYFWALSIFVSLVAGDVVSYMFSGIGFDDRLSDYIHPDIGDGINTVVGFRWDFLIYSAAPIFLGWYVIFKKRVIDSTYLLILGTYILANAFWIMVIRAEFSNRFAYLSWFLYPIVVSYPLLKLKIWPKTQGRKAAVIMAAHYAFTFIMVFLL